jgi:hypothetical protein
LAVLFKHSRKARTEGDVIELRKLDYWHNPTGFPTGLLLLNQ